MAKSGPSGRLSRSHIDRFLKELGIRRGTAEKVFTDEFWRAVRKAGGDPDLLEDGFGRDAQDVYFITEDIAKLSLSTDHDRLSGHIWDFHELNGFPANPRRVAELGGGTGILSMWLAERHPGGG